MITSMTGYGKTVTQTSSHKITIEIRTLNSKNIDLNMRMPSDYRGKELEIRKLIASLLKRGKIDFSLHVESTDSSNVEALDPDKLASYIQQLKQVPGTDSVDDATLLQIASGFTDIFASGSHEVSKDDLQKVLDLASQCLQEVQSFRTQEGKVLESDFNERIQNIQNLLHQILSEDVTRLADVRSRLEKAVIDLKEKVDENRFEQELIYYLEKYDITEEKVRLENHLKYFLETMNAPESQGKKLAFISQEIGREINTIGSKANHAAMQQLVVQMKDELEKIKEQLLNVL
ncbi:YicC/YloC family endoribonuclease [Nonlabens ponticola]|uniref:YicC family protein n=1 Tax=Nonlabens ponticola TaxID=2496866 RepID=A0A3S9MVY8_9FLAO|nr:YicC/YloC family endoribonuclease [Nonlabens ponticola]AZQ43350.1 YicC family protein [Nonlabens ponticola]